MVQQKEPNVRESENIIRPKNKKSIQIEKPNELISNEHDSTNEEIINRNEQNRNSDYYTKSKFSLQNVSQGYFLTLANVFMDLFI